MLQRPRLDHLRMSLIDKHLPRHQFSERHRTLLTTETRVFCPDLYSLLRFASYWMLIRIPSGPIRRRTLHAIKAAAEKESTPFVRLCGATSGARQTQTKAKDEN